MASGRTWSVGIAVVAALAVGGAFAWRAQARAEASQVAGLKALCDDTKSFQRRAVALRELAEIDSEASRAALSALADGKDAQLAVQALATIARFTDAPAKDKLEDVIGDTSRSPFIRSMAVTLYCHQQKKDGAQWSEVQEKIGTACEGTSALDDAADAAQSKLWGE